MSHVADRSRKMTDFFFQGGRPLRVIVGQVGEVGPDWFSVYLIPETLRVTTIGAKGPGDLVNVEVDSTTQVCARRIFSPF